MKLSLLAGTTSKTIKIFIQDSSVTTGAGLTGLVFNTASLTAYYIREGAASATAITLATASVGTWTSSGFKVVDAINMPGVYEVGIPNAAIAAGAKSVIIYLQGAINMAPCVVEIELTAVDNQSATAFMTSIATVTNLTNAPTAGDLTATMKTSVTTAATAATPTVTPANLDVYKRATAVTAFIFAMVTTEGVAAPALTVVAQISKDGGAFTTLGGSVTEISGGWYKVDITGTEMTADEVGLKFTAVGALQLNVKIRTQS